MGNCISKINKDFFLGLEEFMKNKIYFEKGKARPGLDRLTRGTYMRIHSIKGLSKKKRWPRYKLACGGETFFKNEFTLWPERCLSVFFCWSLGPD